MRYIFLFCLITLSINAFAWKIEKGILVLEKGDNLFDIAILLKPRYTAIDSSVRGNTTNTIKFPRIIYDGKSLKMDSSVFSSFIIDTTKPQLLLNHTIDKSDWPSDQSWNFLWFLLGFIGSIYGTILFERWNRFKNNVREIILAFQHFEGYPISPNDLERAHNKSIEFWRLIEAKEWSLRADGNYKAAAEVYKLKSFIYRATAHIEIMMENKSKGKNIDSYLSFFQIEYQRIRDKEFIQFQKKLFPDKKGIFLPIPHPIAPKNAQAVLVNYFDNLN